ncbi:hypothetical protein [Psychrosphaera haliotis]|uniref:Uncharacterized protein n=1 Tax=Psychrosphaera haliotis TaxID=555083 RepID=A0A6N8F760_9GAMM|nr:hypothetical protein [Psychrosphaera haliotis]MUH71994.1 hypothetical protein [Psychrosphaera haliotis]
MEVTAKSITKKSLFKLYLNTFGFGLFIFSFAMGIFALFGGETVTWNDEHYTGIAGLLISIPLGMFLAIWFTFFMWLLGILGMWINSKIYGLSITFRDPEQPDSSVEDDN